MGLPLMEPRPAEDASLVQETFLKSFRRLVGFQHE